MNEKPRLEVVEGCNGFYIYLTIGESQFAKGMGDGAGVAYVAGEDHNHQIVMAGNPGFVEEWQKEIDGNVYDYLEAYFPALYDLRITLSASQIICFFDLPVEVQEIIAHWVMDT